MRTVEVEAGIDRAFDFLADPSNLTAWWPRVVRIESVEGPSSQVGLVWTSVVEADSGRRLRLDYEMVEVEPGARLRWEHRLEGTAFGAHLVRQSTEIRLAEKAEAVTIEVRLNGELKGAAKLAGPSLKSDQKKLLAVALERLVDALRDEV